jgi:hypothetical protein
MKIWGICTILKKKKVIIWTNITGLISKMKQRFVKPEID